jgi:hypothetical protein
MNKSRARARCEAFSATCGERFGDGTALKPAAAGSGGGLQWDAQILRKLLKAVILKGKNA